MYLGYQVILDRIGRCVDQLVHHVLAVHQSHDADLLARPEVLPATAQRVLTASEHLMKVLDELGIPPPSIVDHCVIVIRHRARQQHFDLTPLSCLDETVRERVVSLRVRPEQELTLCAASVDHVELIGKHLTRQHSHRRSNNFATHPQRDLDDLQCGFVRDSASLSETWTPPPASRYRTLSN